MILVTGGTGLVGAHVLLHLLESNENYVRAIYRNSMHIQKTKSLFESYHKSNLFSYIEWLKADITDVPCLEAAFQDITQVYHCAGFISFNPDDEDQLRKINIEGTANIVNICIEKKIQKLCHVSSIAALGDLTQDEMEITETTEWNPEILHSDYAISKYGAEMEVWRGLQEGLQVVIVNPGIILGPGFWNQGSGLLFTTIQKGLPFYTKGYSGYVSVIDVVIIMKKLMDSSCSGERFILISENLSYKDIAFAISKKMGVKTPKLEANAFMLNFVWRFDYLLSKLLRIKRKLSKHTAISLQNVNTFSSQKVQLYLAYRFKEIDVYLDEMMVYFKK